ncbi:MAG: hypothetical protein KBB52_01040 [Candidatus Omnitrophica bacterium]|nr:hypothetical protein [Candidatus Omnitrophota bacterium]
MLKRRKAIAFLAISAIAFLALPLFAQETGQEQESKTIAATPAVNPDASAVAQTPKDASSQPKPLNIYGEVQAVNASAGSMTVQYYDYDADEEKAIELSTSGDTKIENAAAIADIKKGDWADITYSTEGSKNIAKSIVVEKEEEVPAETMPEGETKE